MWKLRPACRLAAFVTVGVGLSLGLAAAEFDHSHALFTQVLSRHVTEARVDYAALKSQPGDLNRFLDQLASVPRAEFQRWNESRQLAFLCNAYNAWTLRLVIDHYPVKSIKNIGGFFSGPWDQRVVRLLGERMTLDELEHERIRGTYQEPRIHFALVCAALGCPVLRTEAYVDTRLSAQLDDQARKFLAAPEKNRVDTRARIVYLSPIFKWYGADFESKSGSVLAALQPFWPETERAALARGEFKIRYTRYDWALNDRARP